MGKKVTPYFGLRAGSKGIPKFLAVVAVPEKGT